MLKNSIYQTRNFKDSRMDVQLVHESEYLKVLNFNIKAGQKMPVHSHDLDGELVLTVLCGKGKLLGDQGEVEDLVEGDVIVCDINVPHGVRAIEDLSLVISIAPPI